VFSARVACVVAAALLLGGAQFAGVLVDRASGDKVALEAAHTAREAAARARDRLEGESRALTAMARDTLAIPPLVTALNERTDGRLLGELLAEAPWWQRYAEVAVAFSYKGTVVAYAQPGLRGVGFGQLVSQVRMGGEPISALLPGPASAQLVCALAVPGATYLPAVVEVMAKPLDDRRLQAIADEVHGSVLVMDGKRPLGRAGPDAALLERSMRPDHPESPEPGWAMSWFSMGPELSLWVGTRPGDVVRAQASANRKRKALLWAGAVVLAAPLLVLALRRKPKPPPRRRGTGTVPTRVRPPSIAIAVSAPQPVAPMPVIDALLARYQLIERIAEGTQAEVFTAISQGGGAPRRSLVVKRMRPELAETPAAVAHFTEEASLLSKLSHPNLVPVYDCGEVDGAHFIAEEYVVGRDLGRLGRKLAESGRPPLSPAGALYVAHEILAGLAYLHAPCPGQDAPAGFVHRELTPDKVMVSRLGKVKLLDFRIMRVQERPALGEVGKVLGNVDFMSPEQARGRPLDARSDLFSVGLLVYHCLTRESLYRGDTHYDRLQRAAHGPGPQELERLAALPVPFPTLLAKALSPNPDRRFQSAVELRGAVAPFIGGGEDEVSELVSELFADELQAEIDHLLEPGPAQAAAARVDRRSG
jgi:hypothetical protein